MSRISPLALASNVFFQHLLSPQKKPFLASYKLTYRCNLHCQQCPFTSYTSPDPTFSQVCQALDQLYLRGDRLVVFEGGEPLLWKEKEYGIQDILRYARQKFACVGATTNGTLPLDVETDVLWVSVDGFEATHNRLRQANIYHRVIENIRRSPHPRLYAHITANAENYTEIPELVRFLSGLVKGITVQFYYPYGDDDRLFLQPAERRDLLEKLIHLKQHQGFPVLNSISSLRALQGNHWHCLPWLVDCVNPEGSIIQGCYLQGRAEIDCQKCGFSPYTEVSLAFRGNPRAILAGMRIFM